MGVSKVVYGNDTLVDLTGDTVTPTSLTLGATAHGANGEPIVGEYQYTLPVASPTTRGGARIQPDSGLEITDTDNLRVRLALESDGTVRGGIAELTAKGHAEQDGTPTPDSPVPIQVVRGRNLLPITTLPTYSGLTFTRTDSGGIRLIGTPLASGTVTLWSDASNPLVIASEGILSIGVSKSGDYEFRMRTDTDTVVGISNGKSSVVIPAGTYKACEMYVSSTKTYNVTLYPQLELGSTPTPYVPYGHVGMEVKVRDLLSYGEPTNAYMNSSGALVPDKQWYFTDFIPAKAGSMVITGAVYISSAAYHAFYDKNKCYIDKRAMATSVYAPSGTAFVRMSFHMDDVQSYAFTQATPIPLPQRGWVAGLPDGTADTLMLDGAGKVEWENNVTQKIVDTMSGQGYGFYNNNKGVYIGSVIDYNANRLSGFCTHTLVNTGNSVTGLWLGVNNKTGYFNTVLDDLGISTLEAFNTWLSTHPITILYPLATPITEDCGYVEDWPTDIPEGAVITIPELDEVGVKYFIDSAVTELAKQWAARLTEELGTAVVELAERVNQLENA